MSKPESIKVEPWTDFPRQAYSIVSDDFVHDKLGTVKLNAKGTRSTINIKAALSGDKGYAVSDEVKLWFSFAESSSIYAKVKSNNYLKLHYDHGITKQFGRNWNFYATLNSNKALENVSLRLGAAHIDEKCNSDNRLKIQYGAENKKNITWYHRTLCTYEKASFGVLGAYSLTQNVISKNSLLLGYKVDDKTSVFLRADSEGFRKNPIGWSDFQSYFDNLKLDVVTSQNNNLKFGLEGIFSIRDKKFSEALFVAQHYLEEKKLTSKLRVSTKQEVSAVFKFPALLFKDIATTSVGVHAGNFTDKNISFKYGGQIEFNI